MLIDWVLYQMLSAETYFVNTKYKDIRHEIEPKLHIIKKGLFVQHFCIQFIATSSSFAFYCYIAGITFPYIFSFVIFFIFYYKNFIITKIN